MVKKGIINKITAACISAVLCTGILFTGSSVLTPSADTQSELEARQAELAKERKDVEALLAKYEGSADETEKYLEEYDNKMRLQEEQIENIEEQIKLCRQEIKDINAEITQKQAEIDEGVELFRQRLRAIYIAGNDSYASVLTGATDFYDVLARMELMQRVSKHDNDIIEDLNSKIAALNAQKEEAAAKEAALADKKAQEDAMYDELRETYNNHAETKAMQEKMIADYSQRFDEIVAEEADVEVELQAEIRRKQEEEERRR